ncbi:MAG TPA: MaoC/PaaZ C-terminal domain-containing protein [Acidimicrobiales bacterium]|nr:MaoC/PaaZ C-terminal domain-containing protein [Acidimicrobiales bacterium]
MPIDPAKALGAEIPETYAQWDADDVILYHLGLGAGVPATDPRELAYVYEDGLKVLPSYGVIPLGDFLGGVSSIDGLQFDLAMLLHGEQDLEIRKAIPTAAKVSNTGRIAGVYDKGKAALVIAETETKDEQGDVLFVNRFSLFIRGEGGWGGESGPKVGNEAPDRAPDLVVESPTLPQQALIYRLSGDKNPLHVDPGFARLGGFDAPILHGLCSYGIVCKAVVDNVLDGDTSKVARYQVRFAGVVFPGETIVTSIWNEGDKLLISASAKERNTPAITNAAITIR